MQGAGNVDLGRRRRTAIHVTIYGDFGGLNQYIDACRIAKGRWNKGNAKKRADQRIIVAQLPKCRAKGPVSIHYKYYCNNKRHDKDNIAGYFHKIFQDALVEKGIIKNDGWNNVVGFSDEFEIDKAYPRIEVTLVEVPNDSQL